MVRSPVWLSARDSAERIGDAPPFDPARPLGRYPGRAGGAIARGAGGPADHRTDTPVWLAAAPEVAGATGKFFVERAAVPTAAHTTDAARCDRLWEQSARLVWLPADSVRES